MFSQTLLRVFLAINVSCIINNFQSKVFSVSPNLQSNLPLTLLSSVLVCGHLSRPEPALEFSVFCLNITLFAIKQSCWLQKCR